jgi:hypothetical protein
VLCISVLWQKESPFDFCHEFFLNPSLKPLHPLPILVAWGICLARNSVIFEGRALPSFKISQQELALLSNFKSVPKGIKTKVVKKVLIDKSMACFYFLFFMVHSRERMGRVASALCSISLIFTSSLGSLIWVMTQITKESSCPSRTP